MNETRRGHRASLIASVLLCIGIMVAWRSINAAMENHTELSPAYDSSAPSAIGSLLSGNTSTEIGDAVFLNNVRLQAGPKPGLFVVSGARGVRILLSLEAPKESLPVPGRFDIKGTIRRLPPLQVLRKGWKLSKDQAHFFGKQHVYLAGEYVKEQNRDRTSE